MLLLRTILLHSPHNSLRNPITFFAKSMAWRCSKCTFMNLSQKSNCRMCSSSPASSSSPPIPSSALPTAPKWSCKACTFLNPYNSTSCEVCCTRVSSLSLSILDDDEELDSSVGSVFLPLKRCNRKNPETPIEIDDGPQESSAFPLQRCKRKNPEPTIEIDEGPQESSAFHGVKSANKEVKSLSANKEVKSLDETTLGNNLKTTSGGTLKTTSGDNLKTLKIMSYNVWFREDLELHKRMKALGDLIQLHSPDLICFQEITANIYDIFQQSSWWKLYKCSVSNEMAFAGGYMGYFCMQLSKLPVKSYSTKRFSNSIMGRELCVAEVKVKDNLPLIVATSHLESPSPGPPTWDQMYSKERVEQAKEALNHIKNNPNVIFCGDMNWDDKKDGPFPLPEGWVDPWVQLKPRDNGWTYDTKSNQMLTGNRTLQKRMDRFVCNLRDFKIKSIDMIGKEAIPGVSHCKEKKVKGEIKKLMLPVLPSDHYGLILTVSTQ